MAKILSATIFCDYVKFNLTNKPEFVFTCDIKDYEIIKRGGWYVHTNRSGKPYIRTTKFPHEHFHREILGLGKYNMESIVDHNDRNTLNCRKYNLSITNQAGNLRNSSNKIPIPPYRLGEITFYIYEVAIGNKIRFQSYYKRKYIGNCATLEELKKKIDKFYEKLPV